MRHSEEKIGDSQPNLNRRKFVGGLLGAGAAVVRPRLEKRPLLPPIQQSAWCQMQN